jgi:beta-fructofuranosidase
MDPNRTATVFYFVGEYKDHRFTPEVEGVLDYAVLYAPLTLQDNQGRRLMWGWLREGRPVSSQVAAGWSGVQSIPRVLTLLPDNHLGMEPVPELAQLRSTHNHYTNIDLSELNGERVLAPYGHALDIVAEFDPGQTGLFGLSILASPDDSEQTRILYDAPTQRLIVDRGQSSLDSAPDKFVHAAPHPLAPGEHLELRILVDGSVVEIIANQRTSLTSRVYPSLAGSAQFKLLARESNGQLCSLDVWKIDSIWLA